MGCNYYARVRPTKERKQELHDAIEADDYSKVMSLTGEMYGKMEMSYETDGVIGNIVHLGKCSYGWKFLWNPNVYVRHNWHFEDVNGTRKCVDEPDTAAYLYPLNKAGIKAFIDRDDVVIYDEYNELQDKEEFWKMALSHEGWDAAGYHKEHPDEREWRCDTPLVNLLEREGYKFSSWTRNDFYSDGLRFSTSTDFC